MTGITDIFDFFASRRGLRRVSLVLLSVALIGLVSTLRFSEDISDFLPLGTADREHMDIYQNISGADKLFLLFSSENEEVTESAIDVFAEKVQELDVNGWCSSLKYQFDMDDVNRVSSYVYENAPYFMTEADYARMDSLLNIPGYIGSRLNSCKFSLLFPSSSFVTTSISYDPLGLFAPVLGRLNNSDSQMMFDISDGYIFTLDRSRAIVMLTSPFGNSETENNSKLIALLNEAFRQTVECCPSARLDVVGGPAIAVGNSERIKKDSILAIALSAVLIVLLLFYSFKSLRNILLIFVSVGWGLIFALGGIALFSDSVSIIVIGISSVILGIAINYPLHLIAHNSHQPDRKACLREIVSPLVVGNITTVGAFLALVPLKSTALRDLGLFASLLLAGTILFVLLYLPHYIKPCTSRSANSVLDRIAGVSPENSKVAVALALVLTLFFSVFSFRTEFDSNIANINYMTDAQRADMQFFEDLITRDSTHTAQTLYVFGKGSDYDAALVELGRYSSVIDSLSRTGKVSVQNDAISFIVSKQEQLRRLEMWNDFVNRHKAELTVNLPSLASGLGFSSSAFSRFFSLVNSAGELNPKEMEDFQELAGSVFLQNFTSLDNTKSSYAVCALNVDPDDLSEVRQFFRDNCFDVAGMNSSMASSLSDNFNYIGWACSLIVFIFLWFSFGRLELAVIAFLPMAVSWIWILGLMALFGIKFNIVNIILATFIFGQGDDYTIFVTEGCQYDFSRRASILKSYKSSIFQSAAIMFVGIGTLIVARHPAMKSLAEVTIIGMFSVVLMAYLIPPLLFRLLTTVGGRVRKYPITFRSLLFGAPDDPIRQVEGRYIYKGKEMERTVRRSLSSQSGNVLGTRIPDRYECTDTGFGEMAILTALVNPSSSVVAHIPDEERRRIAQVAADGFVPNIEFVK